jgi:hypothetical protein
VGSAFLLAEGRLLLDHEVLDSTGTKKPPILYRFSLTGASPAAPVPVLKPVDPTNFTSLVDRLTHTLNVQRAAAEEALRGANYDVDAAAEALIMRPAQTRPAPPKPVIVRQKQRGDASPESATEQLRKLKPDNLSMDEVMALCHDTCDGDLELAMQLLTETT